MEQSGLPKKVVLRASLMAEEVKVGGRVFVERPKFLNRKSRSRQNVLVNGLSEDVGVRCNPILILQIWP